MNIVHAIKEIDLRQVEAHPLSERIFGTLPADRLDDLAQDLQERGVQMPLVLDRFHRIICGSQRRRALLSRGIHVAPAVQRDDLKTEEEIESFLIKDNLHRRHLSHRQLFNAACKLEEIHSAKARERMAKGRHGQLPLDAEKGRTAAFIAKELGRSQSTIERMKRVYESGEHDVIEQLDEERISLFKAAQEVSKRRRSRMETGYSAKLEAVPYDTLKKRVAAFKGEVGKRTVLAYGSYKDEARDELEGLKEWLSNFVEMQ